MRDRRDAWISLVVGVLLATLSVIAWMTIRAEAPQDARAIAWQTGLHLAFGRETAIPAGLAAGLDWTQVFLAAQALEWSMLFLGFPLIVLFGEALHRIGPIRRVLDRAHEFATRRPDAGVLLLGALTLIPWLPFGALTSMFIGEAIGLPSRKLLPVIALAELLANFSFAYLTAFAIGFLPHPQLGAAALAAFFLVLAVGAMVLPRRA